MKKTRQQLNGVAAENLALLLVDLQSGWAELFLKMRHCSSDLLRGPTKNAVVQVPVLKCEIALGELNDGLVNGNGKHCRASHITLLDATSHKSCPARSHCQRERPLRSSKHMRTDIKRALARELRAEARYDQRS